MKNGLILLLSLLLTGALHGQQPPGSEIYLFKIKKSQGSWVVSDPQNITNHPGYDNQPFFHPSQPVLYYVAADETGKTDIVEYNYKSKITRKITGTPDGEFSPTLTPDGKFISCILQRQNGTQDLVKYPIDGGAPAVIIQTLTVGYHAWADNDNVFVFALGEPHTLRWFSVRDQKDLLIAEKPGRSLHRIPGSHSISYIDKTSDDKWLIKKISDQAGTVETLGETLPGREDLTWISDQEMLMSDGQILFVLQPGKSAHWQPITFAGDTTLKGATRVAVDVAAGLLAVVVSE